MFVIVVKIMKGVEDIFWLIWCKIMDDVIVFDIYIWFLGVVENFDKENFILEW